jgi:hypothetical protein
VRRKSQCNALDTVHCASQVTIPFDLRHNWTTGQLDAAHLGFFSYHTSGENGQSCDMAMLQWANAYSTAERKKTRGEGGSLIKTEGKCEPQSMRLSSFSVLDDDLSMSDCGKCQKGS